MVVGKGWHPCRPCTGRCMYCIVAIYNNSVITICNSAAFHI